MQAKWIFVLIGDDRTGKTLFQKHLMLELCGKNYFDKLNSNKIEEINHQHIIRKIQTLFASNRSLQERMNEYRTVENYFETYFRDASICIISSHITPLNRSITEIDKIIEQGHKRYYNVCGVFFENSISKSPTENQRISHLQWDERWVAKNPTTKDIELANTQIRDAAFEFIQMLIHRTPTW